MNLSKQIQNLRKRDDMSQEELAEKIYVSRQTISNWEREKSYPDIHSLLLLAVCFDVSLDYLVKGDLEIMKKEIENTRFRKWGILMTLSMISVSISIGPILYYFDSFAYIIMALLIGFMVFTTHKVEKIKKEHNIKKYTEIVAFMENEPVEKKSRLYNKMMTLFSIVLVSSIAIILMLVSLAIF